MKNELEKLNLSLKKMRLEYFNKLREPLSEIEISALERKYNINLPNDLRELYKWKNGQQGDCYETFVNNSIFEPLESVLFENKELTEMIGYDFAIENWWNENWLPIFSNGGGSSICYDTGGIFTGRKGQLIEYWNSDNDRPIIAPGLKEFIGKLNEYYNETSIEDFDEFFDISKKTSEWKKEFIVDKPIKATTGNP